MGGLQPPFDPGAGLLQQNQTQPRTVGAPASGANACPPVRTEAVLLHQNQSHFRIVGAPPSGRTACAARPRGRSSDYQVSTNGLVPACNDSGGAELSPRSSQSRVSSGSMTASISRKLAMLRPLPRA